MICPELRFEAIDCSTGSRRGSGIGWSAHWLVLQTLHVWIWKRIPQALIAHGRQFFPKTSSSRIR